MSTKYDFIPFQPEKVEEHEMIQKSQDFYDQMDQRRSIREFSKEPVPLEVIEHVVKTASTAPSGAHKQPWKFCVVGDPNLKSKIREAAEKEEYKSYHERMSEQWLRDLEPLGTYWEKPFLEKAPWLIVVFKRPYELENGEKKNNYYVNESVGLATGFLLAALHHVGLSSLTHTPSPMNFLTGVLGRPKNEKPFLLIPVGYPAQEAQVPDLKRKGLKEVMELY